MKRYITIVMAIIMVFIFTGTVYAAGTATWTKPTQYEDSSSASGETTITTKVFEEKGATDLEVCNNTGTTCTFTAPACGTGIHTYYAVSISGIWGTTSQASNLLTWTAPDCPKTLKPPVLNSIIVQ